MIAVPISSPVKSPFRVDQPQIYPKGVATTPTMPGSPMVSRSLHLIEIIMSLFKVK